jgi:pyruvate dehydrogenase E2 component (dihydrolipoamide acetyltransferase)
MASEITVPRLGWNMDEGIFVGWLKTDGQTVKVGEPLFNLEGDKATQEIESLEAGILRIPPDGPKDGEKVAVGTIVGYLLHPGEVAPFDSRSQGKPSPSPPPPLVGEVPPPAAVGGRPQAPDALTTSAEERKTTVATGPMTDGMTHATLNSAPRKQKQPISPRARRAARELGIDPAAVTGTGKTGRIVERDIRAASVVGASPRLSRTSADDRQPESPHSPSSSDYQTFAVTSIRKTIAARMIESRQTTAAVTITTSVDATNLVNLRRQFKAVQEAGEAAPIGYTEIVVKLAAIALAKHPMLNSRWSGNQIQVWRSIHIGIAVDTEAGLMVPVIRDVTRLSLRDLAACTRDLANRARNAKLTASELSGGTFTVSNLGQLGVEAFTPLINPPECAILGLGRIQNQVVVQNKQFVERDRMVLSLTFDHRIVDGAPAARFLQTLGSLIENPSPWLLS